MPLTETQRHEISSARAELAEAIDGMVSAIKANQTLQTSATNLKNKGWASAIWGSISGSNDGELANMLKELCGSLETTQKAVQVVLRLQSRKDQVLRDFHSVLVEKIQKIHADTQALDATQQSVVDVLCEFQEQIEDQLRHHEAVERHEVKISELSAKLEQKLIEIHQWLQSNENQTVSLKNASDHLAKEFDSLRKDFETHKLFFIEELTKISLMQLETENYLRDLDAKRIQDTTSLNKKIENLIEMETNLSKEQLATNAALTFLDEKRVQDAASLDTRIEHLIKMKNSIAERTELIEKNINYQSLPSTWLKRNLVSLVSLLIGGIALSHNYFA